MSARMRVLVDMDGVLADWNGGIETALVANGSGPEILDLTRWDLGLKRNSDRRLVRAIQANPGFYRDLEPIDNAIAGINLLQALGHDVWVCSTPDATNPTCASDKIEWVREHLGEWWVKRTHLTHKKSMVRGDVLIDDKPVIDDVAEAEWGRIVFDQPYNQDSPGVRLRGWADTRTMFEVFA